MPCRRRADVVPGLALPPRRTNPRPRPGRLLSRPKPARPRPSPNRAKARKPKCIAQKEGYTHKGKAIGYAIQLTNLCEQRMKCKVYAHLSNASGESRGHGTLVLAPKSKGAAATKTFEMKTEMDSGMAELSRECKAI